MASKSIIPLSMFSSVALVALLVFGGVTNSRADSITRQELNNFDQFLDNHNKIAQDLRRNPNLVNDPAYIRSHPDLKEFLNNHHGVRDELRNNPRRFLAREGWYAPGRGYENSRGYQSNGREGWREHDAWREGHGSYSRRGSD
jgi:hypothetical protein